MISEKQWRRHVKEQANSGLTISRYCKRHKLGAGAFHYWKKKLAQDSSPSPFVKVVPKAKGKDFIHISLDNGVEMKVPSGSDLSKVGKVVEYMLKVVA